MACPGSFPSSCVKEHPDPKSGWDLDPDKLGGTASFWMMKTTQIFHTLFWGLS